MYGLPKAGNRCMSTKLCIPSSYRVTRVTHENGKEGWRLRCDTYVRCALRQIGDATCINIAENASYTFLTPLPDNLYYKGIYFKKAYIIIKNNFIKYLILDYDDICKLFSRFFVQELERPKERAESSKISVFSLPVIK